MARGEGEQGSIRSHFVERVVRLPMVHVAWDYASNTYTHIKESNKLVNFTLTNAERSVTFVAGQAKPVVMKFEKQFQVVDDLACKGLGTLEEKVPFITKPADEIISNTTTRVYTRIEGIRKYGSDKVKSVTDYTLTKANGILGKTVVDSIFNTVDGALVITETYIDRILPPTKDSKKKDTDEKSGLSRLTDLPRKVLTRSYRTLVLKFEYIQERGLEVFLYPIGIIETSKVQVEEALQYVFRLWETVKKDFRQQKEDEEKTDSTALSIVRDQTLRLIGIIRVIPHLLPMYIYGFASWLEQKRNETEVENKESGKDIIENGNSVHHSECNSNHIGEEGNHH